MSNFNIRRPNKRLFKAHWALLALAGLFIIGGGTLVWARCPRHETIAVTPSPTPNPTSPSSSTKTPGSTTAPEPTPATTPDKTPGTGTTTTAELKAPSGTFVSNHRPSLKGTDIPNTEQSVCTTTPGASCVIQFTKDNFTKALPAQTADAEGNVYWSWDIVSAGLTTGKWKIAAIATLDSKTLTTTDQLALEVQP